MKLWRLFIAFLISWNSILVVLLLWRQQRTIIVQERSVSVEERLQVAVEPSTTESSKSPRVNLRARDSRKEHLNVPDIYFVPALPSSNTTIQRSSIKKNLMMKIYFPDIQDIRFNNLYWQVFTAEDTTFYLFGAYYDCRKSKGQNAFVRIIGMADTVPPPSTVRCALWYSGGQRMVWANPVITFEHLWKKYWGNIKNGTLQPYLISCQLPKDIYEVDDKSGNVAVPEMVSLVSEESVNQHRKPSTNLKVNYVNQSAEEDFVVCVKGLDFPGVDLSWRLLEWVHLIRLLGAHKIYFYELDVHPNVAAVLDYMETRQMAEVIPLTLPGHQPNLHILRSLYLKKMLGKKRLNEIIPYNDCLYRNLYSFKYILLLDIDEVLMPVSSVNWKGLMEQIQSIVQLNKPKDYKAASYNVRNVYFFDDLHEARAEAEIPEYLFMTRHVVRSAEFTNRGRYIKCFHDISRVKALHNHYPLSCLPGFPCVSFEVSPLMAQLQHYRRDCQDIKAADCITRFKNKTIVDLSIWRYRNRLEQLVYEDIRRLEEIIN